MPPVYNKYFLFKRCFALSGGDFSVPSLFHKAIFSFEKHLYDVLKKSVANLEMCEIRVNTHILTGIPRALIYLFSKRYARTKTLFSGVFRPFLYSYVLFYPPSN